MEGSANDYDTEAGKTCSVTLLNRIDRVYCSVEIIRKTSKVRRNN